MKSKAQAGADHREHEWRILVCVWLTCLALLIVLWGAVFERLHTEKRRVLQAGAVSLDSLSFAIEHQVTKSIQGVDLVARLIAYEYHLDPPRFGVDSLKAAVAQLPDVAAAITLVAPDGHVLASSSPGVANIYLGDRDFITAHKAGSGQRLFVSEPVQDPITHKPAIELTRGLTRPDGSFGGVVMIAVQPAALADDFFTSAWTDNCAIAVVADSGQLLWRRVGRGPVVTSGAAVPLPAGWPGRTGFQVDPFGTGLNLMAFRRIAGAPLFVAVGVPEPRVLLRYRQMLALYVFAACVMSALLVLCTALVAVLVDRLLKSRNSLRILSETDPLTGLMNRRWLFDRAEKLHAGASSASCAAVYLDLDNFRQINEAHGHDAGDTVLIKVGDRLVRAAGTEASVARIAGDAFGLLVEGDGAETRAEAIAQRIVEGFKVPVVVAGHPYDIRVSIGVAGAQPFDDTAGELIKRADLAMHEAKREAAATATSRCRVFSPQTAARRNEGVAYYQDLSYAIANGEIFVEYQPIVSVDTKRAVGYEALARWHHPRRGLLAAQDFITIAEDEGLIHQVGEFVLVEACRQFAVFPHMRSEHLFLAINLSEAQVASNDTADVIARCLERFPISPDQLRFEVSESALVGDPAGSAKRLEALRELGVQVVLGNFGRGRSAFANLWEFPVSGLKVDRSFTEGIPDDIRVTATVSSLISLARELDLSVVIEGIHCRQQVEWLEQFEGLFAQGNYFASSRPADSIVG
jgi:diguanylate cyclase (GGDEF)-like protein